MGNVIHHGLMIYDASTMRWANMDTNMSHRWHDKPSISTTVHGASEERQLDWIYKFITGPGLAQYTMMIEDIWIVPTELKQLRDKDILCEWIIEPNFSRAYRFINEIFQ